MNQLSIHDNNDFESVLSMQYLQNDVLSTERDKMRRRASLLKAATLESIHPTEVVLYIESQSGCKKIRSRVIATGDTQVIIERGYAIPIHSIHKIEFVA